jgi:hypothetical protein
MPITKDRAMINLLPEVPQKPMRNRNHILTNLPSQTFLSETRHGPLRITIGTSAIEWKMCPQERRYGLPTLQHRRSFPQNNIPIRGVTCRSNSIFEILMSALLQIRTIISRRLRRHIYHLSQVVYYGTERRLLQCPCLCYSKESEDYGPYSGMRDEEDRLGQANVTPLEASVAHALKMRKQNVARSIGMTTAPLSPRRR